MGTEYKFLPKLELSHIKNILPVVKKAMTAGLNEREIGVLLGYLGKNPRKGLARIEKECENSTEAVKLALKLANSYLVSKLYEVAVGAKYEESISNYNGDGSPSGRRQIKRVLQPEVGAVKLLVKNQLSNLFDESPTANNNSISDSKEPVSINQLTEALKETK